MSLLKWLIIIEACDSGKALKAKWRKAEWDTEEPYGGKKQTEELETVSRKRRPLINRQRYRWIVKAVLLCSDLEVLVGKAKHTDCVSINEPQKQKVSWVLPFKITRFYLKQLRWDFSWKANVHWSLLMFKTRFQRMG